MQPEYICYQNTDPKRPMSTLLAEAIAAYRARFGREPREVLVSEFGVGGLGDDGNAELQLEGSNMTLSNELQIGKAAEHLVCADLILQGYNAFLADQGLPYDVVLDSHARLWRVQVKACISSSTAVERRFGQKNIYRFGMRRAKGNTRQIEAGLSDLYAFVALDIRRIAYLPTSAITNKGFVIGTIEFRSKLFEYPGRTYSNGTVRECSWGRYFEDHGVIAL